MQRKRLVLILCFTLLFLSVYDFSTLVKAEDVDGFRGMKWGDPLPKEGMKFLRKDPSYGGVYKYTRKGEDLKIGQAELDSIEYSYWNGKLSSVGIRCYGHSNFSSLLDAFKQKFGGETGESVRDRVRLAWARRETLIHLTMHKEGYFQREITDAMMLSLSILIEQKEWEKKQAKNGKNGF